MMHSPGLAVVKKSFVPSDRLKKFTTPSTDPGDCLNKYLVEHIFIIVLPFLAIQKFVDKLTTV